MAHTMNIHADEIETFRVVHPLYDAPEEKCDVDGRGPMEMTPGVKLALMSLRAYLVVMVLMVVYHFVSIAR
jgi:hypothetical protein